MSPIDLSKYSSKTDENEPQIRILVCRTCKSIDEMPDYEGNPADDVMLNLTVGLHQKPQPHIGLLFKFPVKYWVVPKVREEIIKQIHGGSEGLDVFGTNFYSTRMTFAEDAMTCWSQHNRPKEDCGDYKSERKLLKPDTAAERKDAGLDRPGTSGPKVYLCDFCPVKSHVQKKAFTKKGLYN
jgi:hypothetical protein